MELIAHTPFEKKIQNGLSKTKIEEIITCFAYESGVLSSKEACSVINKTRREFEEILPKYGLSIIRDTDDSLQIELDAIINYPNSDE